MYNSHILINNIQASSQYFSMTGFGGGFRIIGCLPYLENMRIILCSVQRDSCAAWNIFSVNEQL
jgi:hypothetical protein